MAGPILVVHDCVSDNELKVLYSSVLSNCPLVTCGSAGQGATPRNRRRGIRALARFHVRAASGASRSLRDKQARCSRCSRVAPALTCCGRQRASTRWPRVGCQRRVTIAARRASSVLLVLSRLPSPAAAGRGPAQGGPRGRSQQRAAIAERRASSVRRDSQAHLRWTYLQLYHLEHLYSC